MLGLRVVTDNTDVASDMLVVSLLDVVRERQHCEGHEPFTRYDTSLENPAQVRRDSCSTSVDP